VSTTLVKSVASPKVSIVMPCYNAAAFVAEALTSAFAQTFTDFEVIVVNDGSRGTEELERAIAPWRERLHYIHQANGGVAAARNAALRHARGEWIASLDPDDTWEPTYLEAQLRFLAEHPDADVIYSDAVIFGDTPETGNRISMLQPSNGEATLNEPRTTDSPDAGESAVSRVVGAASGGLCAFEALVEERCVVPHCATLARRQTLIDAGGFDESLRAGEDFDLWLRVASQGGKIRFHREALARQRRRAGSLTSDPNGIAGNHLMVLEKARTLYARTPAQREIIARQETRLRARMASSKAKQAIARGDYQSAYDGFSEAQKTLPSRKLALLLVVLRMSPRLVSVLFYMRGLLSPGQGGAGGEGGLTQRSAWMLIAKVAGFGLSIALPMLLVRRLEQVEFGLYRQVFLIINTAITLLPLSVGMSVYYFLPREPERKGAIAANIMLFLLSAGAMAAGVFLLWPQLAQRLTSEPGVLPYVPAIATLILLWIAGSVMESMMLANQEVRLASVVVVFVQTARTALLVAAALINASLKAVLVAAIIQGVLQCMVVAAYLISRFPGFWRQADRGLLRRQLSYALPLGVAGLLYSLQTDLHNYFVSSRFGSAVFATYSVGCFQLPLMSLIGEATAVVLIPQVALLQRQGEIEQITTLTLRALRKLALVAFPLFCFLMVVAPEFLTFLYTDRYRESVPIFRVNLIMIPMSVLLIDPILRAYAEYRYQLLGLRVLLFILQFSLLWWATSIYGPWSAILIVVGVGFLERIGTAVFCGWIVGFSRRQVSYMIPALHIALAAGAAGLAITGMKALLPALPKISVLMACGMVFGLFYAGLLYSFRIVTPQEVSLVTRWLPPRWRDRLMPS